MKNFHCNCSLYLVSTRWKRNNLSKTSGAWRNWLVWGRLVMPVFFSIWRKKILKESRQLNTIVNNCLDLYALMLQGGEKSPGTYESKFLHIFTKRSFPHLKMLFEQYQKVRLYVQIPLCTFVFTLSRITETNLNFDFLMCRSCNMYVYFCTVQNL